MLVLVCFGAAYKTCAGSQILNNVWDHGTPRKGYNISIVCFHSQVALKPGISIQLLVFFDTTPFILEKKKSFILVQ